MALLRSRSSAATRRLPAGRSAELRPWPNDPTIAHLVLLDVTGLPSVDHVHELVNDAFASDTNIELVRTSAMFPGPRERFADAGFTVADRLALLERPVDRIERIRPLTTLDPAGDPRVRRLTARHLGDAVRIDRTAFPTGWSNTTDTLADIAGATPRHHSRVALADRRPVGFAITGLAGPTGYLQRLAVDPAEQRAGIGRRLVTDALGWLQRRGATTVLVNTGVDNDPALALYRSLGFHHRRDELVVMERRR